MIYYYYFLMILFGFDCDYLWNLYIKVRGYFIVKKKKKNETKQVFEKEKKKGKC